MSQMVKKRAGKTITERPGGKICQACINIALMRILSARKFRAESCSIAEENLLASKQTATASVSLGRYHGVI